MEVVVRSQGAAVVLSATTFVSIVFVQNGHTITRKVEVVVRSHGAAVVLAQYTQEREREKGEATWMQARSDLRATARKVRYSQWWLCSASVLEQAPRSHTHKLVDVSVYSEKELTESKQRKKKRAMGLRFGFPP